MKHLNEGLIKQREINKFKWVVILIDSSSKDFENYKNDLYDIAKSIGPQPLSVVFICDVDQYNEFHFKDELTKVWVYKYDDLDKLKKELAQIKSQCTRPTTYYELIYRFNKDTENFINVK